MWIIFPALLALQSTSASDEGQALAPTIKQLTQLKVATAASGDGWHVLFLGADRIPFFEPTTPANGTAEGGAALLYPNAPAAGPYAGVRMAPHAGVACDVDKSQPAYRFVMLKLATSGSTWIGDLLKSVSGVKMEPEIITGSRASRMTKESIVRQLEGYLETAANHFGKTKLTGFSINDKNMAVGTCTVHPF